MKTFRLLILFLVLGTTLISLFSPSDPGNEEASMKLKVHKSRKLKENMIVDGYKDDSRNIDLLDYHKNNPVPNSKASIRHGPIQHDVPLIPYLPNPPPPEPNDHNHVNVVLP